MNPVSKTAYYCCGIRMMDAESPKPLVNDTYARKLMGDEGLQYWEAYKAYKLPNGTNLARIYLIDNWVRKQLKANPNTTFILIGAGLDSRAFRFQGGSWIELDEPSIIEYKNHKLPVSDCENSLLRISIDFKNEKLKDKLAGINQTEPIVIIVEGVLMYLSREQKVELLNTITTTFKKHFLLCDLMDARFFKKLASKGIYVELEKSGAVFKDFHDDPARFVINYGYSLEDFKSNIVTAVDLKLISIPKFLVKFVFKKLFSGYSSYLFQYGDLF